VPKQLQAALPFKNPNPNPNPNPNLSPNPNPNSNPILNQAALPFKSTPKDDARAPKGKGKTVKQVPVRVRVRVGVRVGVRVRARQSSRCATQLGSN
jgi:hypothetical protein